MRLKLLIYLKLLILLTGEAKASLDENALSVLMKIMLPSMFGLFSNITDPDYKAKFHEPCTFDKLLEIFSKLPPYFDVFGKKYSSKPDLMAYYSMQLASTFLVNNGSLTMECLYNMLSLQTQLHKFSINIIDHPEKNLHLVGLFGNYMKPMMGQIKQNAMMKIIDYVDRYEKNDDLSTITTFKSLNVFFIVFGLLAISSNILLVFSLKKIDSMNTKVVYSYQRNNIITTLLDCCNRVRNRYKTRLCLALISVCHAVYILLNYIVMSQAGLASVALKGLTKLTFACKMAFFMFPPTTAYNICHQLYVWLLVHALRTHAVKIRKTRTVDIEDNLSDDESYDRYQDRSQVPFTIPRFPVQQMIRSKPKKFNCAKNRNCLALGLILSLLFVYNSLNLVFYSLNKLVDSKNNTIYFCAFDETYSDYYTKLTPFLMPLLNLIFFWAVPFFFGIGQILLDMSFLFRIKREQEKRYLKLKKLIERPVYAYFVIFAITQLPFAIHQVVDLSNSAVKFPFVFPLFIQMKFSNKVSLVVIEQVLIFVGLSLDLFVWLLVDKDYRTFLVNYVSKKLCCKVSRKNFEIGSDMSEKSNSDTSVTNPSKSSKLNGYESSTLTSMASNSRKKMQNIAEGIKATAAIDASKAILPYEEEDSISKSDSHAIKMIDTDEDMENLNDSSLDKQNLDTLIETEQGEQFRKNVSLSNPPSFNSAMSKNVYKKGAKYDHQYQNV
ncbi:hypothetical protein BpHYR1_044265 [Brachionus plicatilis]|uniref:G-protein coupled receptors family 1 profile domain-containing protein n=1 Tax=Brachionus plicatilis TaxID=10195 RepID=A0A3M7SVJ9_BRAPC|nr:hypothetical protein BpHYR1_044265 [Brachionus plicatilis]